MNMLNWVAAVGATYAARNGSLVRINEVEISSGIQAATPEREEWISLTFEMAGIVVAKDGTPAEPDAEPLDFNEYGQHLRAGRNHEEPLDLMHRLKEK